MNKTQFERNSFKSNSIHLILQSLHLVKSKQRYHQIAHHDSLNHYIQVD